MENDFKLEEEVDARERQEQKDKADHDNYCRQEFWGWVTWGGDWTRWKMTKLEEEVDARERQEQKDKADHDKYCRQEFWGRVTGGGDWIRWKMTLDSRQKLMLETGKEEQSRQS